MSTISITEDGSRCGRVTPQAWYVAGPGLLAGAERRWLLIDDSPDPAFVSALWDTLSGAGIERVLALIENHYGDAVPSLALIGAGREIIRGNATINTDDRATTLSLGSPGTGPERPLLGGLVAAASVRIPVDVPSSATALIDGIPDDILSTRGPDIPARAPIRTRHGAAAPAISGGLGRPEAADTTQLNPSRPTRSTQDDHQPTPEPSVTTASRRRILAETDPTSDPVETTGGRYDLHDDHDGHTVHVASPDRSPTGLPDPSDIELLREHTHETVLATYCPQGHLNPPATDRCRVCGTHVPRQDPVRAPRPMLGHLRLPTGQAVPLDRSIVLGRKPVPVAVNPVPPHLVAVPPEAGFVSRMHLQVELDGWLVICRDLGSRGGTTLTMPAAGRAPERLRPMEPHVLEPGCRINLADQYEIVYEVTE